MILIESSHFVDNHQALTAESVLQTEFSHSVVEHINIGSLPQFSSYWLLFLKFVHFLLIRTRNYCWERFRDCLSQLRREWEIKSYMLFDLSKLYLFGNKEPAWAMDDFREPQLFRLHFDPSFSLYSILFMWRKFWFYYRKKKKMNRITRNCRFNSWWGCIHLRP